MAENNQDAVTSKNQLKDWWVTRAKPSQAQYYLWMDAYWHKSESIPPVKITGLSELLQKKADADQLQYYAKVDATNIDVDTWKDVLGVGALPENIGTIDWQNEAGFVIEGNAYKKVANPNDGNTYVLNIDGTKVNANTFGKNITNSSNTTNGSYAQTQRVGDTWSWDTNGQSYAIKNLPNKSADASYIDFVGKNSQGEFAKVGYPAISNLFSGLTPTEALTLSQLLNGSTGGGGAINVNLISPPIIQTQYDTNEYVLLRGVNLNLNPTAMSIQILAQDRTTVVATIPNNQIQLSSSGIELVFYYNFYNFPIGDYVIKITSGVKTYITTLTLKTVDSIENVNVESLTWEFNYDSSLTPNVKDSGAGRNLTVVTPLGSSAIPKVSIKSSQLFAQGEDFYIECAVTLGTKNKNSTDANPTYFGLGYSVISNTLSPNALIYMNYGWDYNAGIAIYNNGVSLAYNGDTPVTQTIIFIKTGNLFRTIVGNTNNSKTLSNNSGYSLFLNLAGRDVAGQTLQMQIIKAFKFN